LVTTRLRSGFGVTGTVIAGDTGLVVTTGLDCTTGLLVTTGLDCTTGLLVTTGLDCTTGLMVVAGDTDLKFSFPPYVLYKNERRRITRNKKTRKMSFVVFFFIL
jgi:hypothetical protein